MSGIWNDASLSSLSSFDDKVFSSFGIYCETSSGIRSSDTLEENIEKTSDLQEEVDIEMLLPRQLGEILPESSDFRIRNVIDISDDDTVSLSRFNFRTLPSQDPQTPMQINGVQFNLPSFPEEGAKDINLKVKNLEQDSTSTPVMRIHTPHTRKSFTEDERRRMKYVDVWFCACSSNTHSAGAPPSINDVFGHRIMLEEIPYIRRGITLGGWQQDFFHVPHLNAAAISTVVRSYYTDELVIREDLLEDVLGVAKEFELNSTINCWILKSYTEAAKNLKFKDAVDNFILNNLSGAMLDPGFLNLTSSQIYELLFNGISLNIPSDLLSQFLARWKTKQESEGNEEFTNLFQIAASTSQILKENIFMEESSLVKMESPEIKVEETTSLPAPQNLSDLFNFQQPTPPLPHKTLRSVLLFQFSIGNSGVRYLEGFDFMNNRSYRLHKVNQPREFSALIQMENSIYDVGGSKDGLDGTIWDAIHSSNTVEIFTKGKPLSFDGPSLRRSRRSFSVEFLNGHLFAIGGDTERGGRGNFKTVVCNVVEILKVAPNCSWVAKPKWYLPSPRSCHASAVFQDKIYVAGGVGANDSALKSVVVFNYEDEKWTEMAPMLKPRRCFRLYVTGGKIYAIGGEDGVAWTSADKNGKSIPMASVEVYDPIENVWKFVSPMNHGRASFGVAEFEENGMLVVIGGNSESSNEYTIEAYNPALDIWTLVEWPRDLTRQGLFNSSTSILRSYVHPIR